MTKEFSFEEQVTILLRLTIALQILERIRNYVVCIYLLSRFGAHPVEREFKEPASIQSASYKTSVSCNWT
jgi:hypothetical protein